VEINGFFVPTIWSHNGVIDYYHATPELRAAACKDKATDDHFKAQAGKPCVTVPTRMALKLAVEKYAVAVDTDVDEKALEVTDLAAKVDAVKTAEAVALAYAEVVPIAEWQDCEAKVAVEAAKQADAKSIEETVKARMA